MNVMMEMPEKVSLHLKDKPNEVFLTFDVEGLPPREDFFDNYSLMCVQMTLDLLEEKGLRGTFFITGLGAEQIREYPDLVEQLSYHEIGYHSSIHNARPFIIEYTDVLSYEEALAISLERETSHINPETGQIEGKGGIFALRETFPKNEVACFRAPFFGWSPPHLEALKKLGIGFDFSSIISEDPISFRGIVFYPYSIPIDSALRTFVYKGPKDFFPKPILSAMLRRKIIVLAMHPPALLVKNLYAGRDEYNIGGNVRAKFVFSLLKLLLDEICFLQKSNLIEVTSSLSQNWQSLRVENVDVERIYGGSVQHVTRLFNSNPRFVLSHFKRFFDQGKTK